MKLKLKGIANQEDVIKAFTNTLEILGVDFDRQCLNGVNIYFNVYEINGNTIKFVNECGATIDCIEYTVGNKGQTTEKTITKNTKK